METILIDGKNLRQEPTPAFLATQEGKTASIRGTVHNIRAFGGISFVILRTGRYLFQMVWDKETCKTPLEEIEIGDAIEGVGTVRLEKRAQGGVEILLDSMTLLNHPKELLPLNLADRTLKANLSTKMEYRTAALRHPKERAVFRISEGVETGFRDFMLNNDFVEIHSPKIVGISAEGGAEVFKVDYFGEEATLAQSPQFYKQMCVAFFGRVFEIGAVYRAELHNTSRHLNEYTGLDFEMGYIDSMYDIMATETAMLKHVMQVLKKDYEFEINLINVDIPDIKEIPCVRFSEAITLLQEMGGGKNRNDLTPDDEILLCNYFKEKGQGEFVFVTHFPSAKRPFYVMDDPENTSETLSFDLLFRGLEITTGGQRINDYDMQITKLESRGIDPAQFESFTSAHKGGLPPHGGLGIGLERLVMKLCNLSNIRETTLFPRDLTHLIP